MSKERVSQLLDEAFNNGTAFIDFNENYIYALIPNADGNYTEVSYDIPGAELEERVLNPTKAYRMLLEEIEKGLSTDLEDFQLTKFKDFRGALAEKPDDVKLKEIIKELLDHNKDYSANLPVVTGKDKIADVKKLL